LARFGQARDGSGKFAPSGVQTRELAMTVGQQELSRTAIPRVLGQVLRHSDSALENMFGGIECPLFLQYIA
jgi:hypothetical protein